MLILRRDTGDIEDSFVRELPDRIEPGTVVVLNDTRVRKARLFALRFNGDRSGVEFLLLEPVNPYLWKTLATRTRRLAAGKQFRFPGGLSGTIAGTQEGLPLVEFSAPVDESYLELYGHVPLPPYIKRADTILDEERYQTVYARDPGSSAAPTAGLHFTSELIRRLEERGAAVVSLTLHVGLGTFLPVRTETIEDHRMHEEPYYIPARTRGMVDDAVKNGRKVLAAGTTVVRALESAWGGPERAAIKEGWGKTKLFIYPGFTFSVVNRLFTNFHTPGSTLLALVSAFAGRETVLNAYRHAIEKEYRFFSYGDAMLII